MRRIKSTKIIPTYHITCQQQIRLQVKILIFANKRPNFADEGGGGGGLDFVKKFHKN
jgi:hypothetical protein